MAAMQGDGAFCRMQKVLAGMARAYIFALLSTIIFERQKIYMPRWSIG